MEAKIENNSIHHAIDLLVRDVDSIYDECFVDNRFLEIIRTHVIELIDNSKEKWLHFVLPILEQLNRYQDHEAFVMFNLPRLFKIFLAILKDELEDDDFIILKPYIEKLWDSMSLVIANGNIVGIEILIGFWEKLCCQSESFKWLVNKKLDPPLKAIIKEEFLIEHVSSLARFYIETSKNYHTRNSAENLLETLIIQSNQRKLPTQHWQHEFITTTIRELMLKNNPSIFRIIRHLDKVVVNQFDKENFYERYDLKQTLMDSFVILSQTNENIVQLCKCVSVAAPWIRFEDVIKALTERDKLEEIIAYLASMKRKRDQPEQLVIVYLLYPLIVGHESEEARSLVGKFLITREERIFIEKNMSPKILQSCLVQLDEIIELELRRNRTSANHARRFLSLALDSLIILLKKSLHANFNHRVIMISFGSLQRLVDVAFEHSERNLLLRLIDGLQGVIDMVPIIEESNRHVLTMSLRLLAASHRMFTINTRSELCDIVNGIISKTMSFAYRYDDHDVLNEFATIAALKNFAVMQRKSSREEMDNHVRLVWVHMYKKAINTTHPEFLGNVGRMLIDIDLEIDAPVLEKYGIRRHHQIPKILGDILKEYTAVIPTIEIIMESLVSKILVPDSDGYVCRLDSPTLARSVAPNLNNLLQGICAVARGEVSDVICFQAIKLLNISISEMITNYDDSNLLIKRLIDTDILQTIYHVVTVPLYPKYIYEKAIFKVPLIKEAVISDLDDPRQVLETLLLERSSQIKDELDRKAFLNKIPKILDFYIKGFHREAEEKNFVLNKFEIDLNASIREVIDFEKNLHGNLDCY